jgi:hypothetical protein
MVEMIYSKNHNKNYRLGYKGFLDESPSEIFCPRVPKIFDDSTEYSVSSDDRLMVDGIPLVAGDKILLKGQSMIPNGVYTVRAKSDKEDE